VARSRYIAIAWIALGLSAAAAVRGEEAPDAAIASRCPYDFDSEMPPGRFCVYRGAARSVDGALCSEDLVVIWSAVGAAVDPDEEETAAVEVSFGFVNRELLVLHGVAAGATRALITAYSVDPIAERLPLERGVATLVARRSGAQTLRLTLSPEIGLEAEPAACDFGSYRGVFVGVLRRPAADDEPASGADAAPRPS
jgi:hypothetical protein